MTSSFFRVVLGACFLFASARAAHSQAVTVPAAAGKPAHTTYIYWACNGRAESEPVLPDAPSAISTMPLVNGRFFRECTGKERFAEYSRDTFGVRPFLSAGLRAGIEQTEIVPTGWGQDFPGYAQRYGSAFGEAAIDNTVRFSMAAVLREDVRYLVCHHCKASDKIENAVLAEFTARHGADGHRAFSPTPIVANFSGPLVSYAAWYPPGYGPDDAARHSSLGFATRIGFRLVREFIFDRDTKQEKAAEQSANGSTSSGPSKHD